MKYVKRMSSCKKDRQDRPLQQLSALESCFIVLLSLDLESDWLIRNEVMNLTLRFDDRRKRFRNFRGKSPTDQLVAAV